MALATQTWISLDHRSSVNPHISSDAHRYPSQQPRHSKYYIQDSLITFSVQGQLFRVHRYFFEWESDFFKAMFSLPSGASMDGSCDEAPIPLPGVSIQEFESLLDYFYFRQSIGYSPLSRDHWINLLSIASRYDFDDIRERAIKEISGFTPPLEPVQMIELALQHDVPEWLEPGYCALCKRPQPLNEAEVKRLGVNIAVKISKARDIVYHFSQSNTSPQQLGKRRQPWEKSTVNEALVHKAVRDTFWPFGPKLP